MELIDKSAVVAEIEKLVDKGKYHEEYDCAYRDGNNGALYALKGRVDTLEVKEVDLEKEIQEVHKHFYDYYGIVNSDTNEFAKVDDIIHIAKHFFELGIKSKGE